MDVQAMWDLMPLTGHLGAVVDAGATKDEVVARLAHRDELCTVGGTLHGGTLMALADATGALCAFLNLPEGAQGTTTLQSGTHFLRAVRAGAVTATARPVGARTRPPRTAIVVDTELHDDAGRLVARVTQTQLVLA